MSYNELDYLDRFRLMLTDKELKKITDTRIIIFGVGGVGSSLAHFLVRSGIQYIDLVDFDIVDVTNINRQLVAYHSNIGNLKVDELKKQLLDINPNINIDCYPIKYTGEENIDFDKYDIILDCIDDIKAKKILITKANEKNKYILSAMGAGNRFLDIPKFEIVDIRNTSYDPIAKILRKFCKDKGIKHLDVCYTKQKAVKINCKTIASVIYYPLSMAIVMTAKIINKIIKGD